ncbi:PTS fructose transporter subunit EIIC [Sporolactobacillus vineae]|uniref:PTS fructose transporter subunit EIIC n=1 Tax=Sporolactobacillus vineae TaxID=444463 RepID=UPI0002884671|nr:PTS fructose transporter subunit EIIC [Sporolactobacillus vineae]
MNDFKKLMAGMRKHLMTGVSYMIPFVVAGGVLLALSVLLSGKSAVPSAGSLGQLALIGKAGLSLMVPILSGYIAFSMADRPGIAPGVIGGLLASQIGAGFIGGLISGILSGIVVFYLKKIRVPSALKSIMPILIIPLFGTFIIGSIMVYVIGSPISSVMAAMTHWLQGLGTGNLAILGIILGAMIAFDMGGPVNKVAFSFGAALVGTINPATGLPSATAMSIMAGIGVAICIPPLAMGTATLISRNKFTVEEREAGKPALVMGLVGITEGAIPFAASDPLRVIPSNMIGSAIGASLAMVFGAGNPAPWGGWIVTLVSSHPFFYILASLIGVAVTTTMILLLKKKVVSRTEKSEINHDDEDFDLDLKIM